MVGRAVDETGSVRVTVCVKVNGGCRSLLVGRVVDCRSALANTLSIGSPTLPPRRVRRPVPSGKRTPSMYVHVEALGVPHDRFFGDAAPTQRKESSPHQRLFQRQMCVVTANVQFLFQTGSTTALVVVRRHRL